MTATHERQAEYCSILRSAREMLSEGEEFGKESTLNRVNDSMFCGFIFDGTICAKNRQDSWL